MNGPAINIEKRPAVSIICDPELTYPEPGDYFSPDSQFPEYQMAHLATRPNPVYSAVRQCLLQAGLDRENFGTPSWNPLRDYISPGQTVFVLCNFVQHNIERDPRAMLAKCTHGSVVRAVIDYVLIALRGSGTVRFGNAPLQSCDWRKVIEEVGAAKLQEFYQEHGNGGPKVQLTDLRQQIIHRNALGTVEMVYQDDASESCVPVDLGEDSLLDDLFRDGLNPKLRVLDYDYRRTQKCHGKGRHVYLVSKQILESDVLVSIPKLKTHEKVGMTAGIKGCVGAVAHKDCLAHHRFGSPRHGGDEFPDRLSLLKPVASLHDAVYTKKPGKVRNGLHLLNYYSRMLLRRFTRALSGSWPGNDTCWRMALDLARIIEYADKEGKLNPHKIRPHILFTDGIVAGEGNGPLSPHPVELGYLGFSENIALGDYVNCLAMGFAPEKVPLVREAFCLKNYRLTTGPKVNATIRVNGTKSTLGDFGTHAKKFAPPREWRGFL